MYYLIDKKNQNAKLARSQHLSAIEQTKLQFVKCHKHATGVYDMARYQIHYQGED